MKRSTGDGATWRAEIDRLGSPPMVPVGQPEMRLVRTEQTAIDQIAQHPASELPVVPVTGARRGPARMLLGVRDLAFHQAVLDFLERHPDVDIVGSATEPERLIHLMAEHQSMLVVVCPVMARHLLHPATLSRRPRVLIVAEEMTVPVLREALDVGAEAVFAWPEERDELVQAMSAGAPRLPEELEHRGSVISVLGSRGGVGATFLAVHLAAAFASRGNRTALVDFDRTFAELTVALGAAPPSRTISDLAAVMHELGPDHLEQALFHHPTGFSALLSAEPESAGSVPLGLYSASVALLAATREVVIVHLARGVDEAVQLGCSLADQVLLVVSLDLLGLAGARRTIRALGLDQRSTPLLIVVNKLARQQFSDEDAKAVLGLRPAAAIRFDPAARRASDRGELLSLRSRKAGKDVRRLARTLMPGSPGSRTPTVVGP